MDYAAKQATQTGNSYRGQDAVCTPAIEKPRLSMQLDQLEKVLQECHGITGNVENAANRILGPVPEEGAKTTGRPPSSSVEQRFSELIAVAEGLAYRLGQASSRLNQAV